MSTEPNQAAPKAKTAAQLHAEAFHPHRDPRSKEYKAGCLALLRQGCGETSICSCPYSMGSVQADAWWAGFEEGKNRYRMYLQSQEMEERE